MDHVLNSLISWYDIYFDLFMDEHIRLNLKVLKDNPYYGDLTAIIKSLNVIRGYMDMPRITLKQEVQFRLL